MNGWVDKKTAGMIKELITADAIDSLTRLVLCNAIYFKGVWLSPFKTTKKEPFYLNAKGQVTFVCKNIAMIQIGSKRA